MRTLAALALLLATAPAVAGITGTTKGCPPKVKGCTEVVTLALRPDPAVANANAALFIGIFPMSNGQPNPTAGGYFDGRAWKPSAAPIPAFTGRIPARPATVRIPGGVCGLVAQHKAPAGEYGVFAGWGRTDAGRAAGGVDRAELERLVANADPQNAAMLRGLLDEMRQAEQRLAQAGGTTAVAFTDMRANNTFWLISSHQCGAR